MLPNNAWDLKKRVTKVFRAFPGKDNVFGLVFAWFIDGEVDTAERNKAFGEMEPVYVANLAGDETGGAYQS